MATRFETLVSADTLHAHLHDPDWRVFDCRFSLDDPDAGRRAYALSHLPGALHADIDRDLSGPRVPGVTGRHPLPGRDVWMQTVREFGLTPAHQVVAYDDAGGAYAARLWWMLRWIGHAHVAVLDGGWRAWNSRGYPVSAEVPVFAPAGDRGDYAARAPLTRLIEAPSIDARRQHLLDARGPARFRGEVEPIDPVAGHIPGAVCAPAADNLDASGQFRSPAELGERFRRLIADDAGRDSGRNAGRDIGSDAGRDVVCYCGSGITAAHNVLAMKVAGFDEPALYAGSWSEWITDPARGVATGDQAPPT